jgi:hypothetical protein
MKKVEKITYMLLNICSHQITDKIELQIFEKDEILIEISEKNDIQIVYKAITNRRYPVNHLDVFLIIAEGKLSNYFL